MLADFETMNASWNKLIIFFHIQTYLQLNFDNFICKLVLKCSLKCELIYKKYLEASPKRSPDYRRINKPKKSFILVDVRESPTWLGSNLKSPATVPPSYVYSN